MACLRMCLRHLTLLVAILVISIVLFRVLL